MEIIINPADLSKARRQMIAATASGPGGMATALYLEAEAIMSEAKQDYVPVDTGALRASGFVEPPLEEPGGVQSIGGENVVQFKVAVRLGFGGPSAPYAVIVHEDLTKRHTVGQAKYLETPLKARIAGMPAVLALWSSNAIRQGIQRLRKVEANVIAGRRINWGMPLFGKD